MKSSRAKNVAILALAGLACFLAGTHFPVVESQGGPGRRPPVLPDPAAPPKPPATQVLPSSSTRQSSGAANSRMIAVTGDYGVGTSVLYLVDTETMRLAVYEARGGARSSRRLTLVGARRIDLDLQLQGYNDDSDYSYDELRALFEKQGLLPGSQGSQTGRSGG